MEGSTSIARGVMLMSRSVPLSDFLGLVILSGVRSGAGVMALVRGAVEGGGGVGEFGSLVKEEEEV